MGLISCLGDSLVSCLVILVYRSILSEGVRNCRRESYFSDFPAVKRGWVGEARFGVEGRARLAVLQRFATVFLQRFFEKPATFGNGYFWQRLLLATATFGNGFFGNGFAVMATI